PTVAMMLQSAVLGTVLSAVFSLAYLVQIFSLSPALGAPAVAIVLLNSLVCAASMLAQARLEKGKMQARAKLEGWQASLIENVRTIRATASEEGAFASWAARYVQVVRMDYNGPVALRLVPCIQLAVMLLGTVALYSRAVQVQAETSCFMAVYCAFGMLMGIHLGLSQAAGMLAKAHSQLAVLDSLMNRAPETGKGEGERIVPSGEIQLRDLRFSYPSANTPVIDGLNLHVRSGEFVAVVGESGCGKSTLMRLLLGFEQAQEGAILFDGHDMAGMDARALRRYFGVVLQDARLFKGDILSNITVSAPWLSEEDAWKAAEAAGIAGDIAALPMGMHTVIAEGGAGFSGGQRQRIAIARALAADPKIILFDEATSALDNVTQAHVMDSLKGLDCTRIVIAHRLSTIRECDRIIVLEGGKIAEEGTYGQLMEKGGVFSRLARRQQ
ncbi:MAG: ATP-binding cassette domain-containing protein, partial [Coriobacteriaceae bacterium]|nr:ATP-binding cassette domain-containing protein [Coriobacteriaceae bacterium]